MSNVKAKIITLTKQLFPTGRAFNFKFNGPKDKLVKALAESETRAYNDATSILFSILPDNDFFTEDDATRWEERLGLITNPLVSLTDRKLAIIRKMNHPGDIRARQSWDYLQGRLQAAGFNVFVYENIPEQSPESVLSSILPVGEMDSDNSEMGEMEMGSSLSYYEDLFTVSEMGEIEMGAFEMGGIQYTNLIANHIPEFWDSFFNVGSNYRSTFFVGGDPLGTFANVDANRKDEFRQLILKIKPVQSVGFLFINYV